MTRHSDSQLLASACCTFDLGQARAHLRLGLRILGAVCGRLQEVLDDFLQGANVHLLADVAVVNQSVLGNSALLQLDAEVQMLEHDSLKNLLPSSVPLAGDDIVQGLKGCLLLAHLYELISNLESILRLKERGSAPEEARHGLSLKGAFREMGLLSEPFQGFHLQVLDRSAGTDIVLQYTDVFLRNLIWGKAAAAVWLLAGGTWLMLPSILGHTKRTGLLLPGVPAATLCADSFCEKPKLDLT